MVVELWIVIATLTGLLCVSSGSMFVAYRIGLQRGGVSAAQELAPVGETLSDIMVVVPFSFDTEMPDDEVEEIIRECLGQEPAHEVGSMETVDVAKMLVPRIDDRNLRWRIASIVINTLKNEGYWRGVRIL